MNIKFISQTRLDSKCRIVVQCGGDNALDCILAAPEMLEALKHLSLFKNFDKDDPEYAAKIRDLINKAEGKNHERS